MSGYVPVADRVVPPGWLSPGCTTGLAYPDPGNPHIGHRSCNAPGYQHPVLGWVDVPCACPCHNEETTS